MTLCPPQRVGGVGDSPSGGRVVSDGAAGALCAAQNAALAGLLAGPRSAPLPSPLMDLLRRRWFLWRHGWLRRHVTLVGDPITLDASPLACLRFGVLAGQRIRAAHGPIFVAGVARHCMWYATELGQRTVLSWGDAALHEALHTANDPSDSSSSAPTPDAASTAAYSTAAAGSGALSSRRVTAALRAALDALEASASEDDSAIEAQWQLQAWTAAEDAALARGLRTLATARGGLPWDLPHAMVARAPRLGADPALATRRVGDRCARAMLLLTLSDLASPLAPAVGGEEGDPRDAVRAMAAAAMHPDSGDIVRSLAMTSSEESVEDAATAIAPTLLAWRGWAGEEGAACFGANPTPWDKEGKGEGDELSSLGHAGTRRTLKGLARRAASSAALVDPFPRPARSSDGDRMPARDRESDNDEDGSDSDSLCAEADGGEMPRRTGSVPKAESDTGSESSSSSSAAGRARLDGTGDGLDSSDDDEIKGHLSEENHRHTHDVWTPAARAGVGGDSRAWSGAWAPSLPDGDHPSEAVAPMAAAGLPSSLAAYEAHFPVVSSAASADAWRRTALPWPHALTRGDLGRERTLQSSEAASRGDDPFAWSVVHTAHALLWVMDPGTKLDRITHQLAATQTATAPADDDFEDPPYMPRLVVNQSSPEPLFRQALPQLAWRLPLGLRRQFRSQRPFLADLQERAFRPEERGKSPSDFGGAYRAIMIALVQSAVRDPTSVAGIRQCRPHELPLTPDGPELACPHAIVRFLGAVLGIALRTRVRVPLILPAPVWRAVVRLCPLSHPFVLYSLIPRCSQISPPSCCPDVPPAHMLRCCGGR